MSNPYRHPHPSLAETDLQVFMQPRQPRGEICVVIPAFNEEKVIESSLKALKNLISAEHIYVVSDGSTDKTAKLARSYTKNVLELKQNQGKARALDQLIMRYNLIAGYEYILFSDADSRLSSDFMEEIKKYTRQKPACIVGTVSSDRHGLISAYRTYEYGLTHRIFKRAQDNLRVITVAPGCASLYRSDVLRELDFSRHTLTEDFDLTLQIHRKKLGRIVYAPHARVITQDPPTIKDYWNQVTRWYTGFWQNIFLHEVYKPTSLVNLEIWLIVGDGLSWIAAIAFAITNPSLFLALCILSTIIVEVLALIILALERQLWAAKYMLLFPLFQFINVSSYIFSLFRALKSGQAKLSWQKVNRYVA